MRIKITADSTCDLSKELCQRYNIVILPLHVVKGGESFDDGVTIFPQDVYEYFESGAGMCATAAVNIQEYAEFFRAQRKDCDAIIHINISTGFSSCHQNALLAAQEVDGVYPVDSKNLSTGSGLVVIKACELAQEGKAPEEIVAALADYVKLVEASFVVDKLDYLHKGGRCSAVAALGASVLQLKPCIEVRGGKMQVGKKYRGKLERCIQGYVADRLRDRSDIDSRRIFITDSSAMPEIEQKVEDAIRSVMDFDEILHTRAGCTVSSHCGPSTLGILFVRKAGSEEV